METKVREKGADVRNSKTVNLWLTPLTTPEQFTEMELEWEGGEQHQDLNKRKISRNTVGKTEIRVKTKNGTVVDEMYVWIVWATGKHNSGVKAGFGTFDGDARAFAIIQTPWKFTFTISPKAIVTDSDRPDLTGASTAPAPGANKKFIMDSELPADSAANKWDVSRQLEVTIYNPAGYTEEQFAALGSGDLYEGQPKPQFSPLEFPEDPVEGNDDPFTIDEETDPYNSFSQDPKLDHGVGEITSTDSPKSGIRNSIGAAGDTFMQLYNFREFSRLEIGGKWYKISGDTLWFHALKAFYSEDTDQWENGGSGFGLGNIDKDK